MSELNPQPSGLALPEGGANAKTFEELLKCQICPPRPGWYQMSEEEMRIHELKGPAGEYVQRGKLAR